MGHCYLKSRYLRLLLFFCVSLLLFRAIASSGVSAWGNSDYEYDNPKTRDKVWSDGYNWYIGDSKIPPWMSIEDAKKINRKIYKRQTQTIKTLERENAIIDGEITAQRNRQIAREQLRDWPRCKAMISPTDYCGRYCESRTIAYCDNHRNYVPLAESFTGEKANDSKAADRIMADSARLLAAEPDPQAYSNAIERIGHAVDECKKTYSRRDPKARAASAQILWSVWNKEMKDLQSRARQRQKEWEDAHPEVIAERKAKEAALERERAERLRLTRYADTSNSLEVAFQNILRWVNDYDQCGLPDSLERLRFLAVGGKGLKDGWGKDFYYQPMGEVAVLKSAGPDGEFGTDDDVVEGLKLEATGGLLLSEDEVRDALKSVTNDLKGVSAEESSVRRISEEVQSIRARMRERAQQRSSGKRSGVIVNEPKSRPICTTDPDQKKFSK